MTNYPVLALAALVLLLAGLGLMIWGSRPHRP
jgi:hypothetical protein